MIAKALEAVTPTLRDVGEWLDVSYHTVRSWRLEARTAPPDARRRLAQALRKQAARLEKLADRLEAESDS